MKSIAKLLFLISLATGLLSGQNNILHHSLDVKYEPEGSKIAVSDKITLPDRNTSNKIYFFLHAGLNAESQTPGIAIEKVEENITRPDVGMDRDIEEDEAGVKVDKYLLTSSIPIAKNFIFDIKYSGKIYHPILQTGPEYARGFNQTPGIIGKQGVYLAGSTYWIPWFDDNLFDFDMTIQSPKGWKTVSQGKRVISKDNGEFHSDKWDFPHPTEEAYLIAAPFTEYSFAAGAVTAMAFLRSPDENLANKYLETTAQYLEMYRQLIGPFPFSKFALVENFWETGYGMPSFTLLGEKVIRFPFILHSSYPHELLHNWWGNSVYVDFSKGNWCEGLTAYMADHLIKEQRGQGAEYRRSTLQKFTDYVNPKNDFPVNSFINRNSAASEAIGYGKSLMMWHMLRMRFGDQLFVKAFQQFNRRFKYKRASFEDIQHIFEELSGENLNTFFDQWLTRTGAPALEITDAESKAIDDGYSLEFSLRQKAESPYELLIPVAIFSKNGVEEKTVSMTDFSSDFTFTTTAEPLKLEIDPQFDIFRKLDANEIPPSLSKAFGSQKVLLVLPENSNAEKYEKIGQSWSEAEKGKFTIINESDLSELPPDHAVWFLGTNPASFAKHLQVYDVQMDDENLKFKTTSYSLKNHTIVITARHPRNPSSVVVWLSVDREDAIAGLMRKLPHYGKYSYLVFEGNDPTNIYKGQWPAINSPLVFPFEKGYSATPLPKREALATLPPVFSAKRMMETVNYLSSDQLKGRGIDQPEINMAADYIAEKFSEAGLQPLGGENSYFQRFKFKVGKEKKEVELKNIIGIIPGNKKEYDGQSVVISAHYDHLGLGWPDVYKGNEGKIHHGADDNASGVAVLLELAKTIGNSMKPDRTVIFVAFTAEEAGLVGSRYYVKHPPEDYPINKCIGNLNLDTVGRLGSNKLLILNGSSANEWKFIFMGTGYVTGVESEMVMQPLDASDQVSFVEAGVPAVQFFTGPHLDYHRPTDTADKIDADGMVKVATVAKEVISYLAEREEMMTFTGSEAKMTTKDKSEPQGGGRKVSTGVMPDFAYSGSGVKIGAVSDGSPAANAGVQKGDVIISFAGVNVTNLRDYSNELKKYKPGDHVMMIVKHGDNTKKMEIILKAR